jgi:hypothetical protein
MAAGGVAIVVRLLAVAFRSPDTTSLARRSLGFE